MSRVLNRLAVLAAGLVVTAGSVLSATPAQAQTWSVPAPDLSLNPVVDLDEFENRLMHAINDVRTDAGLRPVRFYDSCVDQMAEVWSHRLASTGEFVHRNQNAVLRRCDQSWAGEDLVRGTLLTPDVVVQAWMDSPSHRAIMLKRRASRAGIAVTMDSQGRFVGVLNLTDPR